MQWASKFFGTGVLPEDLERMLSQQQRSRMGSGALMDAGIAMLANSGYSSTPQSLGQILAQGLGAGRQSFAAQGQMQQEAMQRQQAEQAQRQQAQQYEAMLAQMPPEQAALYRMFSPQEGVKAIADQRGKIALEEAKAKAKGPTLTTLQREAAQLFPDDPGSQAAWIKEQRAKPVGTTVNVNSGQPLGDPTQRFLTPEQRAQLANAGINLPAGVQYTWDPKTGRPVAVEGTVPTKEDKAGAGKVPAVNNANMLFDQMEELLDQGVATGPIAGSEIAGIPLGRAVDYDRKTLFDAFTKQVSPSLRAIFRIPGEGALSDSEQKQYNLMLPQVTYPESVNRALIANLRQLLANSVPQAEQPQQQGGWRIVGVE